MKTVGRNEDCPCKSGRKYKKCHWAIDQGQLDNEEQSLKEVGKYITYDALFPKEENSLEIIEEYFKKYDLRETVYRLAQMNYLFTPHYYDLNDRVFKNFALKFLIDVGKNLNVSNLDNAKIFTRQQMLANIKLAFNYCPLEDAEKIPQKNTKEFDELIFRVTSYLEEEIDSHDEDRIQINFLRNMFLNARIELKYSIARQAYIYNEICEKFKFLDKVSNQELSMNELFEREFDVSLNDYILTLFAIFGKYSNKKDSEKINDDFRISENYLNVEALGSKFINTYKNALKVSSKNPKEFKDMINAEKTNDNFFAFKAFYDNPLLSLPENKFYFLLDQNALEWKICNGAFWLLFSKINIPLKDYWGKVFEMYTDDLIASVYGKDAYFCENRTPKEKKIEGVDFIIPEEDTLILIEATSKRIPLASMLELKSEEVKERLEEILIKHNHSKGKARQLLEFRNKILKREIKLEGVNLNKIKRIIPIILFEECFVFGNLIGTLCNKILINNKFEKDFINDIWYMSIEDLELLLGEVESGKTMSKIIDKIAFSGYKNKTWKNYYCFIEKSRELPQPSFIDKNFTKFAKQINLFNKMNSNEG